VWVRLELRTFQGRKVEGFNKKTAFNFLEEAVIEDAKEPKNLKIYYSD
jgi:hypothetical protein